MSKLLALVDPSSGRLVGYVQELSGAEALRALSNSLRFEILKRLAAEPMFPIDLARKLGVNEQLVYYHVSKLRDNGLVREVCEEKRRGATATKYGLTADGYAVLFRVRGVDERTAIPPPLIDVLLRESGRLVIVLGSPEPHGPFRGRGRDHFLAARLAYAIGVAYGASVSLQIELDTDPRLDLSQGGLIVIGGPAANVVASRLNEHLPIYFDPERGFALVSKCSGKIYGDDNYGVLELVKNFFGSGYILLVAGVHLPGTKAAFAALFKQGARTAEPNAYDSSVIAHVVEGLDLDGDGEIDDAAILE